MKNSKIPRHFHGVSIQRHMRWRARFSPGTPQAGSSRKRKRFCFETPSANAVNRKKVYRMCLYKWSFLLISKIHYEKGDPAEGCVVSPRKSTRPSCPCSGKGKVVLRPALCAEAPCSVMLFTTPGCAKPQTTAPDRFVADYSGGRSVVEDIVRSLRRNRAERLYVIRIITTFDQARASILFLGKRENQLVENESREGSQNFVLFCPERAHRSALHPWEHWLGLRRILFKSVQKAGLLVLLNAVKLNNCQVISCGLPMSFCLVISGFSPAKSRNEG